MIIIRVKKVKILGIKMTGREHLLFLEKQQQHQGL